MSLPLIENIGNVLETNMGSMWIVALIIICFFVFVLLVIGVDFRFAVMLSMPLFIGFSNYGWLPIWVGGVLWVLIVMFAGYFLYVMIKDRA